jgi:transmembrane sensor
LNTQSELRVRISATARNIELVRGEALFEVAKDSVRPFRVRAGATTVQAVGTVFNVYRRANAATVTVIEGKVLVASQSTPVPAELRSREQAQVSSGGAIAKTREVSLERITAWKDRRLVFTGATLQEVANEFNRYNVTQLRVEGEPLAHLNINAVFDATDPDSLVEFLQRTEQVAVRRAGDGSSVLYRED